MRRWRSRGAAVCAYHRTRGAPAARANCARSGIPCRCDARAGGSHAARTMGADGRRRRLDGTRAHVAVHDLNAWVAAQLADLDSV